MDRNETRPCNEISNPAKAIGTQVWLRKALSCTNALVTADSRALCELGWPHLHHHLAL